MPVAALAEAGVFAGTECARGFCPDDPIDRKTMAVWVVRVLDGGEPPAVTESRFDDVDAASFHAPFIERMAELGVTTGCGDGTGFCPDRNVTRAEMAVFLTRAFGLPVDVDPGFPDVPGDAWYVAAVSSLVAANITHGCGDGTNFCPDDDTTRAQMATFLHRALNPASPDPQPVVRVLYVVPADREFRSDYSQAIRRATEHVRWWYQQQLDGLTFSLNSPVPEKCRMTQPHDFYVRYSWERVLDGVQHCAPVQGFTSETVWVIYSDVLGCAPDGSVGSWEDGYGQLGRGGPGLTMLGGLDLEGLTEPGDYIDCDEGPYPGPLGRWIGGLAHELGHAFGLPHPPGCDEGLPSCDQEAMMQRGYVTYPNTYLRDDDKAALRASPFITQHDPLLQPPAIAGEPGGGEAPDGDPGDWRLWGVFESEEITTHSAASIEADDPAIWMWVTCDEWAGDPLGKHVNVALVVPMDAGGVAPTIQHRFSTDNQFTASQWALVRDIAHAVYLQGDVDAWLDRLTGATNLELDIRYSGNSDPTRVAFEWSDSAAVDAVRTACQ